ncbi:MAG: YceD family protein [Myxococcota bacterium]
MTQLSVRCEAVKETPRQFRLEADAPWWASVRQLFRDPDAVLQAPLSAAFEGYRLGARLLFRGRLSGEIALRCSRCGEPVRLDISEPLELLLEPAQNPALIPEGGIELDPEDLELGRYAGDELDFGPVVLEILSLAWPMQPLCSESCAGLCPVCGAVRSRQACSCETRQVGRPFAGLGQMLEESRKRPRRRK